MEFDEPREGTGTREWSETSYNIGTGCSHGCLYCYGREFALRFKKIKAPEDWTKEHSHLAKVIKPFGRRRGVIMYPTQHDITPRKYLAGSLIALRNMLEAGNQVLVVSKPHLSCIVRICDELSKFKDKLMFRFTVGSMFDDDLAFWEPGAPTYEERFLSLHYAKGHGFRTSVSMEPLLDTMDGVIDLVNALDPLVTDTIWIGLMNKSRERTAWIKDAELRNKLSLRLLQIEGLAHSTFVKFLCDELKDNPKVRWKQSLKQIMNKEAP